MRVEEISFDEKKSKFHILVSGQSFFVTYEFYEKFQLHTGQMLSEEAAKELLYTSQFEQIYDDTLRFLSYRIRSEKEIFLYLKKKNVEDTLIEKIIDRLKHLSMIDDAFFLKTFIQDKVRLTDWSKNRVKQELYRKGISCSQEELDTFYPLDQEIDKATKIVEKKMDQWKRKYPNRYQLQGKIYQYLSSRGFQYDTISIVRESF